MIIQIFGLEGVRISLRVQTGQQHTNLFTVLLGQQTTHHSCALRLEHSFLYPLPLPSSDSLACHVILFFRARDSLPVKMLHLSVMRCSVEVFVLLLFLLLLKQVCCHPLPAAELAVKA